MRRVLTVPFLFALSLACSGLFSKPDVVMEEAQIDAADSAEQKRQRGDYEGAEAELRRRLNQNPQDARAWRLLGDVNFTRGQYYQQKWKENLGWSWDYYTNAVTIDPGSCLTWGRLAAVATIAADNPDASGVKAYLYNGTAV